jgi:integrase
MKTEIKNKYCDADKYLQPVSDPILTQDFLDHLKVGALAMFPGKYMETHLKVFLSHVHVLKGYLDKYGIGSVVPGEEFFAEMRARMLNDFEYGGKTYSIHTMKKAPRDIRKIVNEFFLDRGITKRKVLLEVEIDRYRRFWNLTKQSQDAIKWFELNGTVVKATPVYVNDGKNGTDPTNTDDLVMKYIYRVTGQKLLAVTNASKINAGIRLLEHSGKNGFEYLTRDDGEKFQKHHDAGDRKKKNDCPVDAMTFCVNIKAQGFIKDNPFVNMSLKKTSDSVRLDFFSKESIDKLKDLSTVDYRDKVDIRNRALALVGYDLALRINESLALEVSDLHKDSDGEWSVKLRPDVQKGTKAEETMYFFFPETKEILEKYLSIRDEFIPKSNRLFLSRTGKSLGVHWRIQFQVLSQKLGVLTFYGRLGSPHLLRHSFATLNVEPLGLALPIYEIMGRLRHARIETARRHYIHNNPYLKKQKHDLYKNRGRKKTTKEILNEVSLPDLEYWLSNDLGVDQAVIGMIRSRHRKASQASAKPVGQESDNVVYISEPDALSRLKKLHIVAYSLRKYAIKNRACSCDSKQHIRYGNGFRYKEDFIDNLENNLIPINELAEKLKTSLPDLYRKMKKHCWRNTKIGKICYIYKTDCL